MEHENIGEREKNRNGKHLQLENTIVDLVFCFVLLFASFLFFQSVCHEMFFWLLFNTFFDNVL